MRVTGKLSTAKRPIMFKETTRPPRTSEGLMTGLAADAGGGLNLAGSVLHPQRATANARRSTGMDRRMTGAKPVACARSMQFSVLRYDRVVMLVGGRAAAEETQHPGAGVPELVALAGRNRYRVAHPDFALFAFDAHAPGAGGDEVYFLGLGMIMLLSASPDGETRLSQALIADARVAMREQFADLRAVLGDEGAHGVQVCDVHSVFLWSSDLETGLGAPITREPGQKAIWPARAPRPRQSAPWPARTQPSPFPRV